MNKRLGIIKAFTLVEVIVVMVILAILAAMLIPSLTGYIDKANDQSLVTEAKAWLTASQSAVSEVYGKDPQGFRKAFKDSTTSYTITYTDEDGNQQSENVDAIRISNYLFNKVQSAKNHDVTSLGDKNGMQYKADLARSIMRYMDCLDNPTQDYKFVTSSTYGASQYNATDFFAANPKENLAVNVYVDTNGRVIMIQYAKKDHEKTVQFTLHGFEYIDSINKTQNK